MEKTVGKRIRALREAIGLGQETFARECSVSSSWLSKAEIDVNTFKLKDEYLKRIAQRWEVPFEWLRDGKGVMKYNAQAASKKDANIYQDVLYAKLEENNTKLQERLQEAMAIISKLVGTNSLGKLNLLDLAARIKKSRVSRSKVYSN